MKWSDGSYNQLPEAEVVIDVEQIAINEKAKLAMAAIREIEAANLPPLPKEVVDHGMCRGLPSEWFFGERGSNHYGLGRAVCATCPVADACRDWARAQPKSLIGLWGGESQRERRQQRSAGIRSERESDGPARSMALAS
ncbi:WhiB family transcriptional regulator [Candidatus Poriferisodalis sp.]|uniref:WhiB family transcriptional regulator n=1 Tax=Candidatus Poriferisodalis sp. TaxID=3101277 RepID=UPI003D0B2B16